MIAWKTVPKYRYLVNGVEAQLDTFQAQALALKGLNVRRTDSANTLYYTEAAQTLAREALAQLAS
jgi:hypothetical protein